VSPLCAQELLLNGSFETPVAPAAMTFRLRYRIK
jgi:hypothetical protein